MKKLTKKELQDYKLFNRGFSNPVLEEVKKLSLKENLLVEKSDWNRKTPISSIIGGTFRDGRKFSTKVLLDKSGWIITRIK